MSETEQIAGGVFEKIGPEETAQLMAEGRAVLIDIRTTAEYELERIPGALLAPMAELDPGSLPGQESKRVILQCRSGGRTRAVAERLLEMGAVESIAHLEGGIMAWKAAGLPFVALDSRSGAVVRRGG